MDELREPPQQATNDPDVRVLLDADLERAAADGAA